MENSTELSVSTTLMNKTPLILIHSKSSIFLKNFPALVVNDWGLTPCGPRAPSARAHTAKKSSGPAVNLDLWHPSYFLPPAEDIKVCLVIIEGGLHMSISWRKPLLYK